MEEKLLVRSVADEAFRKFGRVLAGYDCGGLLAALETTLKPADGTVYAASDPTLERLPVFGEFRERAFGGLEIQLGFCNGENRLLNALEYHRSSEINVAGTNLILLLGLEQDIDPETFAYDTARVQAFLLPAGTAVELYATTLHYAPCTAREGGFRDAVILPRGTNLPLTRKPAPAGEDRLLFARNKWLIGHEDSGLRGEGAFIGLTGRNIRI